MAAIHNVFHISQLKKCIKAPTEIIETPAIEIEPDLSYVEQPIAKSNRSIIFCLRISGRDSF
jgi:hypothetical protein